MPFQTVKKIAVDRNNPNYKSPARGIHRSRRFRQWSQPARSAGKFRRARRVTRRNPNTRQSMVRNKMMKAGVNGTLETNGSFSTTADISCLTVASKSTEEARNEYCYVVLKKLLIKAGKECHNLTEQEAFEPRTEVKAHFRPDAKSIMVPVVIKAASTGALTVATVAASLKTEILLSDHTLDGLSIDYFCEVSSGVYQPVDNRIYLNLDRASYVVHDKTTIKIQNRTTAGIGAEQNDNRNSVDAVPIHGKILEGRGKRPIFTPAGYGGSGANLVDLTVDATTGINYYESDSAFEIIREPPTAKMIKGAYKESKLHLDPGQIKTYTLISSKKIGNDALLRAFFKDDTVLGANSSTKSDVTTKFVQFWTEKMINTDVSNPVEIGFEVNRNLSISCIPRRNTVTVPYFDRGVASI